jgi:hypothetical protein
MARGLMKLRVEKEQAMRTGNRADRASRIGIVLACIACSTVVGVVGCAEDPAAGIGEVCGNSIDDDVDGAIDCSDSECMVLPLCASASGTPADLPGSGDPDQTACGREREACCTGNGCDPGLTCSGGRCVAAEEECGREREICCEGDVCDAGLACARGRCAPCGEADQPCCTTGSACDEGLSCARDTCIVAECGAEREACCEGDVCDSGFVCARGSCAPCGAEAGLCCASSTCNAGLACEGERCVAASGGDACSRLTSCDACLENDDCGWCEGTCMAGDFLGPEDGDCDWLDWDYLDC